MKPLLILALSLFVFSCAQPSLTGDTYARGEAGMMQDVRYGTVSGIRYVTLEGSSTGGTILGAVAGGLLGRTVGGGTGRDLATAAGAVAGSAVGSRAGQAINRRQGVEITVALDQGGEVAITQEVNRNEPFAVGERVRVLNRGGRARVSY